MSFWSFQTQRLIFRVGVVLAAGMGAVAGLRALASGEDAGSPATTAEIVHVLNRTSFGIRPGDVEAVQKMGLQAYIEQQLHPETIDDSAAEAAVAQLPMMTLSQADLLCLRHEWDVRRAKQINLAGTVAARVAAAGGAPIPGIPVKASLSVDAVAATSSAPAVVATSPASGGSETAGAHVSVTPEEMAELNLPVPPMPGGLTLSNAQIVVNLTDPPQEQIKELLAADQGPLPKDPLARDQELLRRATAYSPNLPPQQLPQAKLVRAVDSKRQLQEVLVDFWTNHFNVDTRKDEIRNYIVAYDRDVIRPHIWGSFRDLLEATAKSPAMLLYLDNASNVSPNLAGKTPAQIKQLKRQGGLNENYGREIMELHTLGVDAGYTQKDVQEVARCFTGWTIDRKAEAFVFKPELHDNNPKIVLGHAIPANGGMQDGETVLDILVNDPHCAHFIAKEMCERFVSDDPPEKLVKRVAGVFTQTQGNLRAVTEAILTSPEFLSPATFDNKIKSPEEFTISAVRASGSTITPAINADLVARIAAETAAASPPPQPTTPALAPVKRVVSHGGRYPLRTAISRLGEPLYNCSPPTGYKEQSWTWVNPGALIGRLNFAVSLTETNVNDVNFDTHRILGDVDLDKPDAVLDQCVSVLLQNKISESTRKVLAEVAVPEAGIGKTVNPNKLIAFILGSPEFQRK